ncbi:MAG TPA: GNAT family N-acetyltransferase [Bacillota bacterium]|nr:GNAT family N-acetyltransferase [Bacillota bacterium]
MPVLAVEGLQYEDLWAIRAVSAETCRDLWPEDLTRAYLAATCSDRALLRRFECSRIAVAWDEGEPCGLIEVARRGRGYELVTLRVRRAWRRRGVATALLGWDGLPGDLVVRVERDNFAAHAFLRARGFHRDAEEWQPFGGEPLDRYVGAAGGGAPWAVR